MLFERDTCAQNGMGLRCAKFKVSNLQEEPTKGFDSDHITVLTFGKNAPVMW